MYESNVADTLNRDPGRIGAGVEGADADADAEADEVSAVTKQSAETLMAGEKIMEAIEMADADRALTRDYEDSRARTTGELKEALMPPTRNPTLIAMGNPSPEDYVRGVMEKVPPAQMEDALLVLPFKQVISLLEYLGMWAETVCTVDQLIDLQADETSRKQISPLSREYSSSSYEHIITKSCRTVSCERLYRRSVYISERH